MAMVKFLVHLPPEQYEALRRLAYQRHQSMGSLVREALAALLQQADVRQGAGGQGRQEQEGRRPPA